MDIEESIVLSKEPFNELLKSSVQFGVELKELDFQILGFNTIYSLNNDTQILSDKELVFFDSDEIFLNETLSISQEYKIKICKKSKEQNELSQRLKLLIDKKSNKIIACINLSGFNFYKNLAMDILQDLYKKMIKQGFFIGLRIFDFKEKLIQSLNTLKDKERKKAYVLICKGVAPISAEQEKLILSYKLKIKANKTQKISIIGVNENELVLKHISAGATRMGRNLRLEFLKPYIPPENKVEFSCSSHFEARKSDENSFRRIVTEYFSKKKGFISQNNGNFDIENELHLSSVNFKDTGAIYAGLDNNVSIDIRNTSDLEEAVGSGVYIECENLTINGNVAGNTVLKAKNLKIYGHTHSTSKAYAQNAYISIHRGYLEADNADIDNLENGSVQAQILRIKKSLGASIKAQKVAIPSLMSNNTIIFSQIAYIENCSGTNNKFLAQLNFKDKDLEPELSLEKIIQRQELLPTLIQKLENDINTSKDGVETLIKTINKLKGQNMPIPPNFAPIIKEFQILKAQLTKLYQEQSELELEKNKLQKELETLQDEFLKIQIINKNGTWTDMNEIKFKFIFPKLELLYATKNNDIIKCFYLKKDLDDNGKIKIENTDKYEDKDMQWLQPSKE